MTPALKPLTNDRTVLQRDDHVHDWTLIKHLGSGGNSEVWRAKKADDESEDEVALKILTKQGDRARDCFVREVDVNTKRPHSANLTNTLVAYYHPCFAGLFWSRRTVND